jgi:hypothetical protein
LLHVHHGADLKTDIAGLKIAINKARDVILKPLQAADLPITMEERNALQSHVKAVKSRGRLQARPTSRPFE